MKPGLVDMPKNPTTTWWKAKKDEWMQEYANAAQERWEEYSDALLMEAMATAMAAADDKARVDWLTEISRIDNFDHAWLSKQQELEAEFSRRYLNLGFVADYYFFSIDDVVNVWWSYYTENIGKEPPVDYDLCYYELSPDGDIEVRIQDKANHNIGNINCSDGGIDLCGS